MHQQERHPRVRRQLLQQRRESFQPTRRSPDTYDWKKTDVSSRNSRSFCFLAASWHTFTLHALSPNRCCPPGRHEIKSGRLLSVSRPPDYTFTTGMTVLNCFI